jgi:hypothetical protein
MICRPLCPWFTISPDRINALPIDGDVSSSLMAITDDTGAEEEPLAREQPVSGDLPPPNAHSMVPNLNITATEADLLLQEISGRHPVPPAFQRPPSGRRQSMRRPGETGSLLWPSRPYTRRAGPISIPPDYERWT